MMLPYSKYLQNVLPQKWLQTRQHCNNCLLRQLHTLWKFLFQGDAKQIGTTTSQEGNAGLSKVLLENKITDYNSLLLLVALIYIIMYFKNVGLKVSSTWCSFSLSFSHLSSFRYSRRDARAARSITNTNGEPFSNMERACSNNKSRGFNPYCRQLLLQKHC